MIIRKIFLTTSILLFFAQSILAATTVSKTPEDSFKSAAAIYVISRDDIKRSGATTIPEVLRMVPGLQVAQGESGHWVVTSRGFANSFANKLLVMVDGRTIYNSLFSGVYWGAQDTTLENIKQIEVIRGPGATQWGANAVNGVINIITESAANTQGGIASAIYGNHQNSLSARYGGKIQNNSYYRVSASRYAEQNYNSLYSKGIKNDYHINRSGFRVDYDELEKDLITVVGDIYNGSHELDLSIPDTSGNLRVRDSLDVYGGSLTNNWQHQIGNKEESQLQIYYDKSVRNYSILSREIDTFDIDLQYSNWKQDNHKITSGVGYRFAENNNRGNSFRINFTPNHRNTNLYSGFIQDEITISPDKLFLTLGSKLEHNDFSGYQFQPSAKASWLVTEDQTIWTSVARATRTPNISENDIKMVIGKSGGTYIRQQGDGNFDSEKLIAYELGYRVRPNNNSLINLALFYNDYDSLRSAESVFILNEEGKNYASVYPRNYGKGTSKGFEIDGSLKANNRWELKSSYSFLKLDLDKKSGSTDSELEREQKRSPKHQFNIQSRLNITDDITFDNILYYVSKIRVTDNNSASLRIPSYYRFDTHIGWQYSKNISFDFVGQNLLDDSHTEFSGALWSEPIKIGRTVYAKVTFKF